MHKIKLFFIINTFSGGGGAESLLSTVVNALDDTGRYEISVMEIIHFEKKTEPVHESIKIYPYYTDAYAPDRKARMYYVYHEWDSVIAEYVPTDQDVYISWNYLKPTFLLPRGKRCISWIHGDLYNLINRYPGRKDMSEECELQREAFKKALKIVTVSGNTKQSVIDIFPEYECKTCTINNGINIERVRLLAFQNTSIVLERPAIIYIGRLDKNKNPLRALEIFRILHERVKEAHLYFLGYGDLTEDVQRAAVENGVSDRVHLLGYHDNPFPIVRQADVTLMTSYEEGFPMALLESVALGVPFVSSRVGGSTELTQYNSCGSVFDDNEEAVDALYEYICKEKEEIQNDMQSAIENFSLEEYIKRIEELLNEVLSIEINL